MSEHKLKKKAQETEEVLYRSDNRLSTYTKRAFIFLIATTIILIGLFLTLRKSSPKKPNTKPTYSNTNFSINFPSNPSIQQTPTTIYKKPASYTTYSVQSGQQDYIVRRYYLANSVDFSHYNNVLVKDFLQSWMTTIGSSSSWKRIASTSKQISGKNAECDTFSYNSGASHIYFCSLLGGEIMYNIFTLNVSQQQSNSFIDSFNLIS